MYKLAAVVYDRETAERLRKKLFKWWAVLSDSGLLVVYTNGHSVKSAKKIPSKQLAARHLEIAADPKVKVIIWSSISQDALLHFCEHMAKNEPDLTQQLLKLPRSKISAFFVRHMARLTTVYKLYSSKDRTLAG